ncbi:Fic family protein [Cellulosimicrobium sp. I38E]|uniref:Fic family protein n=1 Tax=Cellulosimicrobium sp. I38E TaxID=1393139 RepID=UPI0007B27251|nr:Fic family protein [Cellulosimicrobium sp. I38E]KZM77082.1 cell filamentation protein Fic [Cellulosimicrobium sp. I38E]
MSGLDPDYGSTPLDFEELDALLPEVAEAIGDPVTKTSVYELEQAYEDAVREAFVVRAAAGELSLTDLLTDWTLRDLHARLYENIWTWAGVYRQRELSIGIDPVMIAVELRSTLENLRYRWEHAPDWTVKQLAIATHAEAVRIHPFVDGNGRSTRLLADLVLLAATPDDEPAVVFDWDLDKTLYIPALRRFDQARDPSELADLVGLVAVEEG